MVNKDDKAFAAFRVVLVVVLKLMPLVKSRADVNKDAPDTDAGTEVRLSVNSSNENNWVLAVVNSSFTTL